MFAAAWQGDRRVELARKRVAAVSFRSRYRALDGRGFVCCERMN